MPTLGSSPPRPRIGKNVAPQPEHVYVLQTNRQAHAAVRQVGIPWGVVGMIMMVLAVEYWVGRNWLDFNDPVSLSWRFSAGGVQTEATRCELLCLGDSLIKHGLIPSIIEETTGRSTVNLSAARAPALLTYFLLRRALDAGARPEAVIINAKPAVLMAGLEFNARYWQELLTLRECVDLSRMASGGSFVLSTIVGRLLPSVRARAELRSNVLAALRSEPDHIGAINRVLWRNWTVNRGANVAASDSRWHDESEPEIERRMHPNVFYVDRTNAAGLESLMRLADERKIPVFWLLTPLSPDLQARRDQSGADAGYERFVRSFQEKYPQVLTVLDARRGAYPRSLFTDHTHLNGQGAIALSHAVASAIRDLLATSRSQSSPLWIALARPLTHPAVTGPALEDLDQSKEILNLSKNTLARSSSDRSALRSQNPTQPE
jgi:hypothetical protein